jgi:hypothetical protein
MKIMDGFKQLTGAPARIPDCSRKEFPEFLVEMGYKAGAEIGVYKGEYTERLCKVGLKIFAIDPWAEVQGQGDGNRQARQDFLYGHACRTLAPYDCVIIRKTSMDALQDFPDESLDFVYIDGDHSFRYIAEDICEWSKKVRVGGIVSGHDYFNTIPEARKLICQVRSVVDAYTKVFGITNWHVFGQIDPEEEPDRKERFLSWMWIK